MCRHCRPAPEPDVAGFLAKEKISGVQPFARIDLARGLLNTGKREDALRVRSLLLPIIQVFNSLRHRCDLFALIGESYFIEDSFANARHWLERAYVIGAGDKPGPYHKRMLADAHVKLAEFEQAADLYRRLLEDLTPGGIPCPGCTHRP